MPPSDIDRLYRLINEVKKQFNDYININQALREKKIIEETTNKIHLEALQTSVDDLWKARRAEKEKKEIKKEKWIDNILFKVIWKVLSVLVIGLLLYKMGLN